MTVTGTRSHRPSYLVDAMHQAGLPVQGALDMELMGRPGADPRAVWMELGARYKVSDQEIAVHVAAYFRTTTADLTTLSDHVLRMVPAEVARRYLVCPVREENRRLVVATSNPTDLDAERVLGFISGRQVEFVVAPPEEIHAELDKHYTDERALDNVLEGLRREGDVSVEIVEDVQPVAVPFEEADAAPVVKLANLILREAIEARASDVHVEGHRHGGVVRFRVDGVLRQYMQLPASVYIRVASRIKILAKLDIADRLRPQDGRGRIQMFGRTFDLRVSTMPTRYGEKCVLRILDPQNILNLAELGITETELARFQTLLGYRNGLVVATGPTGSGKTTTLYAGVATIATPEINVTTVEDPIEYDLDGVNQIQVETKQDLTFATALRSVLRQDPDVIFVGEIRDRETAQVAIQACMTGHLVLATLHTNDAVGVVPRLKDLGIDNSSLAASFRGAIAQRLIRRVCPECAEPVKGKSKLRAAEKRAAEKYGVLPKVRATGCRECGGSGYRGRLPVTEVMVATKELEELVQAGAAAALLVEAAKAGGMRMLAESVLDHVTAGVTTLDEVERVLGEATREAGTRVAPAHQARPRILLCEDDPVTRKVAQRLLLREGFEVLDAPDGKAGLDLLARHPGISLVLTDYHMPGVDGRGVLAGVRQNLATAMLPVIVLTASAEENLETTLLEAGADDYIRKPIDPGSFIARVRGVLARAGAV